MNSQQLSCFILVTEKLSFTKAAEELYLSVPTVTHHIQSLEAELNTTLFIRDKHKVVLTSSGQSFYHYAKELMDLQDLAIRDIQKIDKGITLRIICSCGNELSLLSEVLKELKKEFPDIKPDIKVIDYAYGLSLIRNKEADIMLGSDNMAKEDTNLKFIPCCTQNSYAVINKEFYKGDLKELSFNNIENIRLITIQERLIPSKSRNKVKDLINIHKGYQNDIICDNEEICFSLIKAGFGIAVLPQYRIPRKLDDKLLIIPVKENEKYTYGLLLPDEYPNKITDTFISIFKKKSYSFICI